MQILNILGVKFKSIDVLTDSSIRQGIKDFSDWPTVPQIYIKGEFIGSADIMRADAGNRRIARNSSPSAASRSNRISSEA